MRVSIYFRHVLLILFLFTSSFVFSSNSFAVDLFDFSKVKWGCTYEGGPTPENCKSGFAYPTPKEAIDDYLFRRFGNVKNYIYQTEALDCKPEQRGSARFIKCNYRERHKNTYVNSVFGNWNNSYLALYSDSYPQPPKEVIVIGSIAGFVVDSKTGQIWSASRASEETCVNDVYYTNPYSKNECYFVKGSKTDTFCNYHYTIGLSETGSSQICGSTVEGDGQTLEIGDPLKKPTDPVNPDDPIPGDGGIGGDTGSGGGSTPGTGSGGDTGSGGGSTPGTGSGGDSGSGGGTTPGTGTGGGTGGGTTPGTGTGGGTGGGTTPGTGTGGGTGGGTTPGTGTGGGSGDGSGDDPTCPTCTGGTLREPSTKGSFTDSIAQLDLGIKDGKTEIINKIKEVKDAIAKETTFELADGNGQLQCDSVHIETLNVNFELCLSKYADQLGGLRFFFLFIATLIAFFIVFKD